MESTSKRLPGADGLSLHALEWSSSGVPLVLLHGFGNEAHFWDDLAPELAPYYRTLAVDLRGHGDSDRDVEGRYDHLSMAHDLESLTEALGFSRLVLIGHSLGGRVALRFAGRNPEKLAGLVLVDSGPDLDARGTTRIRLDTTQQSPTFTSVEEYEQLLGRIYPEAEPESLARLARTGLERRKDGQYERKLDTALFQRHASISEEERRTWAETESKALWEALGRIECPTLVVRGAASDVLSADVADRMVETARRGLYAEIPRAGHSVMLDNPPAFRKAVTAFALGED
jgi:pimeloyl-ACP methyl ester carboxylesterase